MKLYFDTNKKTFIGFIVIITFFVVLLFYNNLKPNNKIMILNYIITETNLPDSFDPLKADKGNNILMMRMLYFTPIQINSSNELISNVFDKFEYNNTNFTITFTAKKSLGHFSDGSEISKQDILTAILRVAYFMPNFPVIKDIVGVHEWSSKKRGIFDYPQGISLDGDKIKIKLLKHNQNALFRFCLELFSIIPAKCIDLKTGKLICVQPPSSGYYELDSKSDKEYKFKINTNKSFQFENIPYKEISFHFKSLDEACSETIEKNTIIAGTDLGLIDSKCTDHIKSEQIHWLQASRFATVLFNPNIKPFDTAEWRRFYSDKIRDYFSKNNLNFIISKSIFTKLLPGYLSDSNFQVYKDNFPPIKDIVVDVSNFKGPVSKKITKAIINITEGLQAKYKTFDYDINQSSEHFLENKFGYLTFSSGFWAQDPIGDVSMFFAKNLHAPLKYVWQDKKMYELINEIEGETDPTTIKLKMENLNRHLYEESLIAPIVHFRRLYITHESIKSLNLPMAVTSPAPWHLVPTE